jgi:rSAM/selenodomain-associated transferase 1
MVDAASAPVVAILTRAPSSGGKTRLFSSLGVPPDPALLTALLLDTIDGAAAPGVRLAIAVTPREACEEIRRLTDLEVMPQPDGDLGDRMRGVMAQLLDRGAPAAAVIGSDVPHLAVETVAAAFAVVLHDRNALVLGPADDGGYYLLAAARVPNVFADMTWGGADVLAQTEAAALADGFSVHRLTPMSDVDTAVDLRRAVATGRGRRTAEWYERHAG